MITNFKVFENKNDDDLYYQLSEGDYVLINAPDVSKKQIVCRLTEKPEKTSDGFIIYCTCDELIDVVAFYDYEIVKILSKEEVDFYKNLNKYNL